ncbi:type VI secretion system Vgr family protein [Pseudomonas guariconensis]|uniref:type VI secretion system Vgr family protein n=1 Tax=Pseudomonas guariconensis TaxID=1288410 RepID=UPI0018AA19EC|nr:type VI secretion system tip protein TssI/VgrG [Pseudomonas guariconensis]MBF8720370.1 type VI secretion system tip protein VgrG [Pseudomonas guariconensis]
MPSQSDLHFSFQPLVGSATFEVVSFTLDEGLSTPFELHLELVSTEDDVDFGQLLDQPVLFTLWRGRQAVRHVHGLVSAFSQGDSGFHRTRYQALVEPQLARARLRANWRIFQQKTAPQILELMFKAQRLTQVEWVTCFDHQVREFCVQAGETDLAFITRLAAEEGFIYRFEHTAEAHKLIITDRLLALGMIEHDLDRRQDDGTAADDIPITVQYHPNSGGDQPEPALRRFRYHEQVRTACQTQRDYCFRYPGARLEQYAINDDPQHQAQDYEFFDYPGRYKREAAGKPFTQTRLNALRHDARMAETEGDDMRLQPGLSFILADHPRQDLNAHWRVVSVHHEGSQFTSLQEEAAQAQRGTRYEQTAKLVPGQLEWRPAPLPKPRIDGPHMATVVGPPDEQIYCDEWGRVKVSFPWDRESQENEFSSCWIRVSQGWAGGSWGSMAIPRIGQEVIVQYVNADPDQPLITGRTYCGNQLPPYELPKHKTRMTIKSQTHKGQGFNELRFEDELGQEEVFIHAQRDQNNVVKHDETTLVGNDRREQVDHDETVIIGHDRSKTVGNDERMTIGRNSHLEIGCNQTISINANRVEQVGNNRTDTTTANHTIEVGGNLEQQIAGHAEVKTGHAIRHSTQAYEIHAAESVTIRAPGGTLRIDAEGITLDGINLRLKGSMTKENAGAGNAFPISSQLLHGQETCGEQKR